MADIFLSYANEDRERVATLARELLSHGWSVWWDRVIPAGRVFDEVIEEEIDSAKCIIVVWSHSSVKSRWVKTEAEEGSARGILVPVLIDEVTIPLAFRRIQAASFLDWRGTLPHSGFDQLVQDLTRVLGQPNVLEAATSQSASSSDLDVQTTELLETSS